MGLTEKVYILAGVTPMKSLGMARYMKNNVPGMDVPDEVIDRLKGVERESHAEEGIKMACEQIEEFKEMKGVAGRPPHGHRVGAQGPRNRRTGRACFPGPPLTTRRRNSLPDPRRRSDTDTPGRLNPRLPGAVSGGLF